MLTGEAAIDNDSGEEDAAFGVSKGDGIRPFMRFRFSERPDWWWAEELDCKYAFKLLITLDEYNRSIGVPGAVRRQIVVAVQVDCRVLVCL